MRHGVSQATYALLDGLERPHLRIMAQLADQPTHNTSARDTWTAVKRGFLGRCPNCGIGRLFGRYLKVVARCSHCGEPLDLHRADDLPAYLVILIVGHVVVGAMLAFEAFGDAPIWLQMLVWPTITLILALLLLQPVKGAIVGLQWALRMHGFGAPIHSSTNERG
jgi:uncharacterized protein (DUF983 family)